MHNGKLATFLVLGTYIRPPPQPNPALSVETLPHHHQHHERKNKETNKQKKLIDNNSSRCFCVLVSAAPKVCHEQWVLQSFLWPTVVLLTRRTEVRFFKRCYWHQSNSCFDEGPVDWRAGVGSWWEKNLFRRLPKPIASWTCRWGQPHFSRIP